MKFHFDIFLVFEEERARNLTTNILANNPPHRHIAKIIDISKSINFSLFTKGKRLGCMP